MYSLIIFFETFESGSFNFQTSECDASRFSIHFDDGCYLILQYVSEFPEHQKMKRREIPDPIPCSGKLTSLDLCISYSYPHRVLQVDVCQGQGEGKTACTSSLTTRLNTMLNVSRPTESNPDLAYYEDSASRPRVYLYHSGPISSI
ncbi:hypothetical protein E2C01_017894 [Portunus trituberculatus]|uniref:Uncharacterized protein n=1 Tax=Portunus trituberculatus TaxID=210409 RepID=A0A5B7DTN0_PORTR|nr:hypothetical protein [Portunus trituberculatus]